MGYERDEAMRVQAATEDMIRMREPIITAPDLGSKAQRSAARAMLAALKDLYEFDELCWKVSQSAYDAGREAIAQAEKAGIGPTVVEGRLNVTLDSMTGTPSEG